jgi:hypothetical protein
MTRLYMCRTVYLQRQLTTGSSEVYVCDYKNFTTTSSLDHLNITVRFCVASLLLGARRTRIVYSQTNECSENLIRGVVYQVKLG